MAAKIHGLSRYTPSWKVRVFALPYKIPPNSMSRAGCFKVIIWSSFLSSIINFRKRQNKGTIYFLTQKREKEGIQIGRFQASHSHICGVTGRLYESFYVSHLLKNFCAIHLPRCPSVLVTLKFHFSQLESVL